MTAYVPNAFTPNNDGVNDILEFVLVGVESFEFRVFNRRGNRSSRPRHAVNSGMALSMAVNTTHQMACTHGY